MNKTDHEDGEIDEPGTNGKPRRGNSEAECIQSNPAVISFAREAAIGVCIVGIIGLLLFGVSGVWPPFVAIESGSMEPHMFAGDLVFVIDEHRFVPNHATANTGVVTYRTANQLETQKKFGRYGDVIIFEENGASGTPTIHRAHFWVEGGENWYEMADPEFTSGESCDSLPNCPAPHAGFITKGDNNGRYDQADGTIEPVRPEWIRGRAVVRIPLLGHVRLAAQDLMSSYFDAESKSGLEPQLRLAGYIRKPIVD